MARELASYDAVAGFYDTLAHVWSLGRIPAAKRDQLAFLRPGQSVLHIGCGSGGDVLAAARHGCQVTAVDTSRRMLDKLQRRLDRAGLRAELHCQRIQEFDPDRRFDAVCANFFLNCFPDPQMRELAAVVAGHVRPDGLLMIADVAPPQGSSPARLFNRLYLHGAMLPFWLSGLVHWHPNHDYLNVLDELGWAPVHVRPFRVPPGGPVMYRNIVAQRRETADGPPGGK